MILVAVSTSVDYIAALGASGDVVQLRDRLKSVAWILIVTAGSLVFARNDAVWIGSCVVAGSAIVLSFSFLIDLFPKTERPKFWLIMSLSVNLGILAFFKYFGFFVSSFSSLLGTFGVHARPDLFKIILPVGLSFYTFQAISRTIDSYRGVFIPGWSLVNYASYHAFFPQLVAGPIERAGHLMPQFERVLPLTWRMITSGVSLFLWGLAMKAVVADNVAPIADSVFNAPAQQTAGATVAGIIAFTFQIYGDFAGYSNMARGLARCLGFDLMINFEQPYFSRTPSEFWRRWHISLSGWLRDYLYIPLGGSRDGEPRTYRNLMITMLIGGLWHGAGWNFVFWGGFHGFIQVVYRFFKIDKLLDDADVYLKWSLSLAFLFITSSLVMIGWVFFRASTATQALSVLRHTIGFDGYNYETFSSLLFWTLPLIMVEILQRAMNVKEFMMTGPFVLRFNAVLIIVLSLMVFGPSTSRPFIYFDF